MKTPKRDLFVNVVKHVIKKNEELTLTEERARSRIRPYLGHGLGTELRSRIRPYLGYGISIENKNRISPYLGYGIDNQYEIPYKTISGIWHRHLKYYQASSRIHGTSEFGNHTIDFSLV
ncbi:UvrABC system C [Gossypium australe]|uniref:UvrABC system C n=1 Tax=Gossypium australe TaxID=47621 RepID=A0A5B6UWI8_9ROSI|nr:UvrABC system C [Gossypium australe]